MLDDQRQLAYALDLGKGHVVLVQHVDNLAARISGYAGHGRHRQRKGRQDRGRQRRFRIIKEGKQLPLEADEIGQQQCEYERWKAHTQNGDGRGDGIPNAVVVETGHNAQHQPQNDAEYNCHQTNADGDGEALGQQTGDRQVLLNVVGNAKIPMEDVGDVLDIAGQKGLIQPVLGLDIGALLRRQLGIVERRAGQ